MRILFLSFYFEPDLCAGSFRNTCLFQKLLGKISGNSFIHVITTQPNRYNSYSINALDEELGVNYKIERIHIPKHKSGYIDQIHSFYSYYSQVMRRIKNNKYDLVYASSSRLFTAFLASRISNKYKIPLYLDIRDIFVDTIEDVLNHRFVSKPLIYSLKMIEKKTFSSARHINLVSEGFREYFNEYDNCSYSYYTNGIDDVFLNEPRPIKNVINAPYKITYAGNIGAGQGLEKIIPQLAKRLGEKYNFQIIGDGGKKKALKNEIEKLEVKNVELYNPVSRNQLIQHYNNADFLFLHLNDLSAFDKVLPSKIFEYAVFPKPIIAGVSGYAAKFIRENVVNSLVFNPVDTDELVHLLAVFEYKQVERKDFIEKYNRGFIMSKMADSILNLL